MGAPGGAANPSRIAQPDHLADLRDALHRQIREGARERSSQAQAAELEQRKRRNDTIPLTRDRLVPQSERLGPAGEKHEDPGVKAGPNAHDLPQPREGAAPVSGRWVLRRRPLQRRAGRLAPLVDEIALQGLSHDRRGRGAVLRW